MCLKMSWLLIIIIINIWDSPITIRDTTAVWYTDFRHVLCRAGYTLCLSRSLSLFVYCPKVNTAWSVTISLTTSCSIPCIIPHGCESSLKVCVNTNARPIISGTGLLNTVTIGWYWSADSGLMYRISSSIEIQSIQWQSNRAGGYKTQQKYLSRVWGKKSCVQSLLTDFTQPFINPFFFFFKSLILVRMSQSWSLSQRTSAVKLRSNTVWKCFQFCVHLTSR